MHLLFQVQNFQLLIFCMDGQEFLTNLDYFLLYLLLYYNQSQIFLYCFIILLRLFFSFLHIKSLLVSYAHHSIKSIDPILLSSFDIKAILLISSVKTFCLSLSNLCCVFNISPLFFTNSF